MKRLILLSCALFVAMMSWAENDMPDFRVVFKDGSEAYFCGADTELTFSEDATMLYVTMGANEISYLLDGVEAIEFALSGAYRGQYSYEGIHVDVAIEPADDSSFGEIEEECPEDEDSEEAGDFVEFYDPENFFIITYNGNTATYSGNKNGVDVEISGAHVVVYSEKKDIAYTLKGSTSNGSFKLYSEKKTRITLDGVSIINPDGPAINIQSGKTMFIELADGTTNYLEDSKEPYKFTDEELEGEDGEPEQKKGTFFSEGQLIFSGWGALNVKSHQGHGIASDDYVRIREGNFNIVAVNDGISTKDYLLMYGGELTINAGKDGIDVGDGYIEIGGGKLQVQAGDEGITASYEGEDDGTTDETITPYISVKGGLIKVTTTGDKGHALRAMSNFDMSGGIIQATTKGAGSKALMSEGDMSLTGGKITAFTEGDALYEEGELEEGELSSSAGIRSKGALTIENMTLGVKSTGAGSKGINNVGDITMTNSRVTVVTSGTTYESYGLDAHTRGIATEGNLIVNGGSLQMRSADVLFYLSGNLAFLNETVFGGYQ